MISVMLKIIIALYRYSNAFYAVLYSLIRMFAKKSELLEVFFKIGMKLFSFLLTTLIDFEYFFNR